MPARGPIGLVGGNSTGGNFFRRGKSGGGVTRLRDRNSTTDERTDSGRDLRETFIEQRDLRPVDDSTDSPVGMNGLNGCLQYPGGTEMRIRDLSVQADRHWLRVRVQKLFTFNFHLRRISLNLRLIRPKPC